jgi:hypothetical protein
LPPIGFLTLKSFLVGFAGWLLHKFTLQENNHQERSLPTTASHTMGDHKEDRFKEQDPAAGDLTTTSNSTVISGEDRNATTPPQEEAMPASVTTSETESSSSPQRSCSFHQREQVVHDCAGNNAVATSEGPSQRFEDIPQHQQAPMLVPFLPPIGIAGQKRDPRGALLMEGRRFRSHVQHRRSLMEVLEDVLELIDGEEIDLYA